MPTGKQAEDQRTITISIGKDLVQKIDVLAKKDDRNRSQWIARELKEIVAQYEARENIVSPFPGTDLLRVAETPAPYKTKNPKDAP